MVEGFGVNIHCLGVGFALDLLLLQVGFGGDPLELTLLRPLDFGGLAEALRTKLHGDAGALGNHAFEDFQPDFLRVIDPLEPKVEQLDAKLLLEVWPGIVEHLLRQRRATPLERLQLGFVIEHLGLIDNGLALPRADDLDEIVRGDNNPSLAVENVVEPLLGTGLVPHFLEEQLGIHDAPTCVGVDEDEQLVLGGHLVGIAIPLEVAFLKRMHFVDEWNSKIEAGFILVGTVDGTADNFTELGDKYLLGFIDNVH